MAGDWIKVQCSTPDKPEVFAIAERLSIDPDAVVGKLIRIWSWADQHTYNGNAECNAVSVTKTLVDRVSGVPGFADAMREAGWLSLELGRVTFPNFERHNGETAKSRALTSKRVARHRAVSNAECNAAAVTEALPEKRREEKRREEENTGAIATLFQDESQEKTSKAPKPKFVPPTLEEITQYVRSRNSSVDPEQFHAHYSANGWVQGKGKPIKDWKSCIVTWEKNATTFNPNPNYVVGGSKNDPRGSLRYIPTPGDGYAN